MVGAFGLQEVFVLAFAAAIWLLPLGAAIYLFSLLRGIHQSLRKVQTEIEELRRDLERAGK